MLVPSEEFWTLWKDGTWGAVSPDLGSIAISSAIDHSGGPTLTNRNLSGSDVVRRRLIYQIFSHRRGSFVRCMEFGRGRSGRKDSRTSPGIMTGGVCSNAGIMAASLPSRFLASVTRKESAMV